VLLAEGRASAEYDEQDRKRTSQVFSTEPSVRHSG
jgi:hypothetical protein